MTNRDILQTALRQSAMDSNCRPEDFLSAENKVVLSKKNPAARKYLELPFLCDFTSYGSNIVASVSPEYHHLRILPEGLLYLGRGHGRFRKGSGGRSLSPGCSYR